MNNGNQSRTIKVLVVIICIVISMISTYLVLNSYFDMKVRDINEQHINEVNNINDRHQTEIEKVNKQLSDTKQSLSEAEQTVKQLQDGNRYETHDPVYSEVVTFIRNDRTDKISYDEERFSCLDYATELNNNAEKQGIRCYVVELYFEDSAHAIVGFDTVDKGMVYIEPQSDEFVKNLEIGNDYWTDCVIPENGYYYEEELDDTIIRIITYW